MIVLNPDVNVDVDILDDPVFAFVKALPELSFPNVTNTSPSLLKL
jgi:hypothetical protein